MQDVELTQSFSLRPRRPRLGTLLPRRPATSTGEVLAKTRTVRRLQSGWDIRHSVRNLFSQGVVISPLQNTLFTIRGGWETIKQRTKGESGDECRSIGVKTHPTVKSAEASPEVLSSRALPQQGNAYPGRRRYFWVPLLDPEVVIGLSSL
jgi:hypothetical protein